MVEGWLRAAGVAPEPGDRLHHVLYSVVLAGYAASATGADFEESRAGDPLHSGSSPKRTLRGK